MCVLWIFLEIISAHFANICVFTQSEAKADKSEPVDLRPILANMRGSPPVCDTNRCAISCDTGDHSGMPALRSSSKYRSRSSFRL